MLLPFFVPARCSAAARKRELRVLHAVNEFLAAWAHCAIISGVTMRFKVPLAAVARAVV